MTVLLTIARWPILAAFEMARWAVTYPIPGVPLALLAYAAFLRIRPVTTCRKCRGWGAKGKRKRRMSCKRCKGTGKRFRLGAPLVHRGHAAAIRYVRTRLEERQ